MSDRGRRGASTENSTRSQPTPSCPGTNVCSAHFHVSEPAALGGDVVVPLRESEFSQPSRAREPSHRARFVVERTRPGEARIRLHDLGGQALCALNRYV